MFVAGTLMAQGGWKYGTNEVEFSGTDPTQEFDQLTDAALSPSAPYELDGQTKNTVFMDSVTFHDGQWCMYYGAGAPWSRSPPRPCAPAARRVRLHELRDSAAVARLGGRGRHQCTVQRWHRTWAASRDTA